MCIRVYSKKLNKRQRYQIHNTCSLSGIKITPKNTILYKLDPFIYRLNNFFYFDIFFSYLFFYPCRAIIGWMTEAKTRKNLSGARVGSGGSLYLHSGFVMPERGHTYAYLSLYYANKHERSIFIIKNM